MRELDTEILVVGGGLGGVAAALGAASHGRRVVLTEETGWLGGQLTAQAVPPDENPWIERFGSTRTYRELREGIRDHYRRHYPLRAEAARRADLNPGAGRVSKLCHEPRVALAVIEAMLAPHVSAGRIHVLRDHRPVEAHTTGDRVDAVVLESGQDRVTVKARYVLDATENGDLLPLTGTEHVTGAEARSEHGEPHAPDVADPADLQGFTYCFAVSHHEGENHVIDRPELYGFWRDYQPDFWPGPLLGFVAPDPRTLEPVKRTFVPNPPGDPLAVSADQSADAGDKELWAFRRILARNLHTEGAFGSDITLVNWPLNDYWLKPAFAIPGHTTEADVKTAHHEAKQLSLSVLYWLQTEAPRADGGTGFPGLRLRLDVTGTEDGLAKSAYVREARRIKAVTTVTEHDVSAEILGVDGRVRREDAVGVGSYRIDLHPSTGGRNYVDVASVPYEIPLGTLLPVRMANLLPAGKNIGTTHITNGCFRLHPVEWNVGEVAGLLAAFAVGEGVEPKAVREDLRLFEDFARVLDAAGVERRWPEVRGY
ncbi:FAD-dependent oxidoreductase [Amycolatopsis sp. OK19-0408]|uniref:FAD-dependent oxidoreductase n=1 Tax=Amycolatopsis iheyensis TaxID=2945988 RepID=A0A9X2NBT9_9PSEU|nr:FAD-dependent oxidoreductase [Amycolatopsis iheyensis]MCR6485789.1 FAD-dependent oxidoreductase [Amycolatopsis iheyensis]